jgi:hypothetical protein
MCILREKSGINSLSRHKAFLARQSHQIAAMNKNMEEQ